MYKIISAVVGIIFSVIMVFILWDQSFSIAETMELGGISPTSTIDGDTLLISWETGTDTNGKVSYVCGTDTGDEKYYEFRKTHKVKIDITGMSCTMLYDIKSCDHNRECVLSQNNEVTI